MDTLIRMKVDDINQSLIDFLQQSFKGRKIEFHIMEDEADIDETDFVLRDPVAKERILKAAENINQDKNLKEYTIEEFNTLLNDAGQCDE